MAQFSPEGAKRIKASTEYIELVKRNGPQPVGIPLAKNPGVLCGQTDGTISKRVDDTPGYGNVTIQHFIASDGTLQNAETIKIRNPFQSAVGNGVYVEVTYGEGGLFWLSAADCPEVDST